MRSELLLGLLMTACTAASPDTPSSASVHPSAPPAASSPAPVASAPAPAPSASVAVVEPPKEPCGVAAPADMACIPAGAFTRGLDTDPHRCIQSGQPAKGKPTTMPSARIELDAYFIDITEVTYAAYRACVDKKACRDVKPLYYDFDHPEQPMTGMSFYDAVDYCKSLGKRLPTEAEWEKAARGPDGDRTPFGNDDVTCASAIVEDDTGRACGVKKKGGEFEVGRIADVKSRPAGRYGLYDMVGNAEEWVADWWSESYAACGDECLGKNPLGPCGGAEKCPGHAWKVIRGGSWYWMAEHATGYHRRRHFPENKMPAYHHFGFRCAKSAS